MEKKTVILFSKSVQHNSLLSGQNTKLFPRGIIASSD